MVGNDNARPLPRIHDKSSESKHPAAAGGIHMEAGAVVINGVAGAADLEEKLPQMMSDWWERMALQTGTG